MQDHLNGCKKIETAMAEVYRRLAGVESYSEKPRGIFAQMARDEDDHASQLEQAREIPEEVFTRDRRFDQRKLDELLRQAEHPLQLATASSPCETLMLETAKDLELEFIKIHLQNSVRFRDETVAWSFPDMAREEQAHFETLDSFYENG